MRELARIGLLVSRTAFACALAACGGSALSDWGTDAGADAVASPTPTRGDAGRTAPGVPVTPTDAGRCPAGQKPCAGACVSQDDPLFGCGSACNPCAVAGGVARCAAGTCVVASCRSDRADCDRDGVSCEVALASAHDNCGACGTTCAAAEVCNGGACSRGCGFGLSNCSGSCVDLLGDPTHCGTCAQSCSAPLLGTASCSGGQCGVSCGGGQHLCGGQCVSSSDLGSCGASCTPCQIPANATPTCDGAACGFVCKQGYQRTGATCTIVPTVGRRTIFVSSASYAPGNFGGLAGADAKCQSLAQAAGLAGSFKAWLSDSTTSAAARMTHSDGPYVLTSGAMVAANWAGLVSGSLLGPINLTETKSPSVTTGVWTNTWATGLTYDSDRTDLCADWTDPMGSLSTGQGETTHSDSGWTLGIGVGAICDSQLALLYCVQQ